MLPFEELYFEISGSVFQDRLHFIFGLASTEDVFELYKNKVVLNMGEVEEILNNTVKNTVSRKDFLLSEIEINLPNNEMQLVIKKIMKNIEMEGFENTAKKYSISQTAETGGSLGLINEKKISIKIL